ncbi:MAG: hypothetical protein V9H25_16990 [Candidatus Competibacter sp.]
MNMKPVSLLYLGVLAGLSGTAHGGTITVGTVDELQNAVATANSLGGNTTIAMRDGTYTLSDTLYVNAPNVAIVGQSGDRTKVIIQGDAMSGSAKVGNVIRVAASNFQLSDVTLQKSKWHLIQIAGETNADAPVIKNCILRDAYEQMLKVTVDTANPSVTSDNGLGGKLSFLSIAPGLGHSIISAVSMRTGPRTGWCETIRFRTSSARTAP